ncbi:MAG: phosphatase PAP2 family protein [Verrucomicrobiota bacterium]
MSWPKPLKQSYRWLRRQDLLLLLLMLLVVLGLWAFLALAHEMTEGETRGLDEWAIRVFRNPSNPAEPIGPKWLESAVRDITALGSATVLLLVLGLVAGFVIVRRQYHALGLILGALGGGLFLNVWLKRIYERPRPELVPPLVRVSSASFPSGHSLLSAVVYLTLCALLARLVQPMKLKLYILGAGIFVSFLVGVSRVYLGVHYPTDVLAGWTAGAVWAVICWLLADYLQRRGWVEKPEASSAKGS